MSWRKAATLAMLTAALGGCSRQARERRQIVAAIADGSARAALQGYYDRHPQCALALRPADDNGKPVFGVAPANVQVRALVQAGLLQRQAGEITDGEARYGAAPSAARWFQRQPEGGMTQVLCFGRRHVTGLWIDPADTMPHVRYAFTVELAPWAQQPEVQAAFPSLQHILGGQEYVGENTIFFDHRQPDLSNLSPTAYYLPFYDLCLLMEARCRRTEPRFVARPPAMAR